MQPVAVAKRYARALADYAEPKPGEAGRSGKKDTSSLEPLLSELALVRRVLDGDPKFARFFADPSIDQKDKKAALEAMARKGKLIDAMRNFLLLLVTNRRLGALGEIVRAFEQEKDERLGIVSPAMAMGGGSSGAIWCHADRLEGVRRDPEAQSRSPAREAGRGALRPVRGRELPEETAAWRN